MRLNRYMLLLICSGLIPLFAGTARPAELSGLTIRPEVLNISTFYSGGQVTISGEVPNEQEIMVEIIGPAANGEFDLKGRVGPFWMTNGKAELKGAPTLYVLLFPNGQDDWHRKAAALGFGLEKLKTGISIQSASLPPEELFHMFLDLKKSEGCYLEQENAITYASAENGRRRFTAHYHFPRSTVVGKYVIKATAVSNGTKIMAQTCNFLVEEVGFTRLIDDLATNKRLAYGIIAVVIALFTGAVMGILFKGGGSH